MSLLNKHSAKVIFHESFDSWCCAVRTCFTCLLPDPEGENLVSWNHPLGDISLLQAPRSEPGERGPTGLSVQSCPGASPDRSASIHRRSGSPASAVGRVEPRSAGGAASASATSQPRALGQLVEVAPLAPLRHGDANGTSIAGVTDATPSVRCCAKFSFKTSPGSPCSPAAMTPRPMTTSTTPTATRCFCLVTPLWRHCCCLPVRLGLFHHNPAGLPRRF